MALPSKHKARHPEALTTFLHKEMKSFRSLSLIVLAAQQAFAHYRFLNLQGSGDYEYIREWTNDYAGPITNVTSPDLMCNLGAANKTTGTLSIAAGSTVTFNVNSEITHPGPLFFYMAKAPGSVNGWSANGDVWFKIAQTSGILQWPSLYWPTWGSHSVNVTIPSSTPSGEYLLRVEHIGLHAASLIDGAQFYISCAQVNVTGGGYGTPGPLVSFPGAYKANDPGIRISLGDTYAVEYITPGPAVWTG